MTEVERMVAAGMAPDAAAETAVSYHIEAIFAVLCRQAFFTAPVFFVAFFAAAGGSGSRTR